MRKFSLRILLGWILICPLLGQAQSSPTPMEVRFPFGIAVPHASSIIELDDFLVRLPPGKGRFVLSGHTDSVGTGNYNLSLSRNRVSWVRSRLEEKGWNREQIKVDWEGEERPVMPNTTSQGRARNRRVEVLWMGERAQETGQGSSARSRKNCGWCRMDLSFFG